jgi:hypothetical protein
MKQLKWFLTVMFILLTETIVLIILKFKMELIWILTEVLLKILRSSLTFTLVSFVNQDIIWSLPLEPLNTDLVFWVRSHSVLTIRMNINATSAEMDTKYSHQIMLIKPLNLTPAYPFLRMTNVTTINSLIKLLSERLF